MKHQKALSQFLVVLIVLSFLFSFYHFSVTSASTAFGYTTMGTGTPTTDDLDRMRAAIATAPNTGNVASLSTWIEAWAGSGGTTINAKCAIYKVSDNSLVGYTDERSCVLTESFQLFTFTCSSPIPVVSGTNYYLTLFKDYSGIITSTAANDVADNSDYYQNVAYGDFPSTCSFSTYSMRITIFANYTDNYFPYIQQASNIDGAADIGTHGNFSAQQYAPASNYDLLTEADTDTGTSNLGDTSGTGTSYRTTAANEMRLFSIQAVNTGQVDSITFYGRGNAAAQNCKGIVTDSSGNLLTNGVGDAVSVSTTAGSKTLTFTNKPLITAGTTYWFGIITAGAVRIYYDSTTGGTDKQDTTNSYTTPTSPTDAGSTSETWRIFYANITELNYQLQLEEQFTNVPTNYGTNYLCVNTGGLSAENLNTQIWNGSWQTLGALSASQWNNYTVNSYIGNSSIYIRFLSATESNDNIQSTWNISSVYFWAYNSTNYSYSYSAVGIYSVSGSPQNYREFASLLSAAASVTSSGTNSYLKELASRLSSTLLLSGVKSFSDELSYALKYTASLNSASTLQNELAYLAAWASSIAGQSLSSKELLDSLLNYISINGQSGLANELLISLAASITFSSLTNMSAQTQISTAYSFLIRDYLAVYGTTNLNLELQYVQNWIASLSDKNLSLKELASSLQAYISANPSSYNLLAKELQYVISALSLTQTTNNMPIEIQILLLRQTLSVVGSSNLGLEIQYVSVWASSVSGSDLSLKDLANSLQAYILANPSNSSLLAKELQYTLSVLSLIRDGTTLQIAIQVAVNDVYGLNGSLPISGDVRFSKELAYLEPWLLSVSDTNLSAKELATSLSVFMMFAGSSSLAKELLLQLNSMVTVSSGILAQFGVVFHDFFYSIAESLGLSDSLEAFANSLNSLFPPRTETVGGFALVDIIAAVLIGVILAVVVCISLFMFNRRQSDDD